MSETAKVRLVRCPKCENLLPEVTDYSVYQCGGCGAVLRAKNNGLALDTFSEKSDEERIGSTVEKLSDRYDKVMIFSEGKTMDVGDGSESDERSSISSFSRAGRRVLCDRAENNSASLTSKVVEMDFEADVIQDKKPVELDEANIGQGFQDLVMYQENEDGQQRSEPVVGGRIGGKSETEGLWRAQRIDNEVMDCAKDGPSGILSRSSYDNENPPRSRKGVDEFNSVDYVEDDRAELFKKLDELKDQLSRSGNLTDKGKEKVPYDRRMACKEHPFTNDNWHPDASFERNQVLMQDPYPEAQFNRLPYHNQYDEPTLLRHRRERGDHGFYPPQYAPSHDLGYGDPSRSHIHRRDQYQAPIPYQMLPSHHPYVYRPGPYMDDGMVYMDTMEPYPPNFSRHQPSCSCYQCCSKRQIHTLAIPTAYSDKYSDIAHDRIFGYHEIPSSFGSRDYNQRLPNPPTLRSHNAQSHKRWPADVDSEVGGFVHRRHPRVHLVSGGRHCRPIAGGAPFLTCCNCFELLLLPKIAPTKNNGWKKVRCGACSTLIVFAVSNKNLVLSYDAEARDNPVEVEGMPPMRVGRHLNQARTTFSSDDYDYPGYDFYSMGRGDLEEMPTGQGRANRHSELKNRHSTSTHTSEAEEDWESLTAVKKDSRGPPPPVGSSLQDHFEYSNKYHVANRTAEGNRSGRSEHEKVLPNKTNTRQMSMKESSATEIDLSSSDFNNTGTTFDSGEANREGDHLKVSKAAESFFAGIIKKSFKDSSRSNEMEKASVTVNGHLIPDRLIKKAEKLAGPIHPGHYWYDFRAGFWGAVGGPCLGILPPYIEEFNYPMLENCAGGNTHVFVNGRELHQKDLNLLGSRGLPTERDRSYIIEISGRVLDEDTGEEMDSLGKLAPTVERLKHGFGMKTPKPAA